MRFIYLCLVSFLIGLFPSSVWACAVCFSAEGKSLEAYYLTTIFLSLLPMLFVGGAVFWFRRQASKRKDSIQSTCEPDSQAD